MPNLGGYAAAVYPPLFGSIVTCNIITSSVFKATMCTGRYMRKTVCLRITKYYGSVLLVYAMIEFMLSLLQKDSVILQNHLVRAFNHIAQISALAVFQSPLNFFIGYGLFRQRRWALHIALISLALYPLQSINSWLYWGDNNVPVANAIIQLCCVTLTFIFMFSLRHFLVDLKDSFYNVKWKRFIVIASVSFICLSPLLTTIGMRAFWSFKSESPFLNPKLVQIDLQPQSNVTADLRRIKLLDLSLMIPQGLTELYVAPTDKDKSGSVILSGIKSEKRWIIRINTYTVANEIFKDDKFSEFRKNAGITNLYDAMKFILTNNWNPMAYMMGIGVLDRKNLVISEFSLNGSKGFIKKWESSGNKHISADIFKEKEPGYREIEFTFDRDIFSESYINNMLSSINFMKPSNSGQAVEEAEKGMLFLKRNDILSAQSEFINAYFHSEYDPDYLLLYLKTLPYKTDKQVRSLRYRLYEFSKRYPRHTGGQAMNARFARQHPI
jgi:uncharacterized membrane protein (DUF2068 family)